jgi:hypothetical protein
MIKILSRILLITLGLLLLASCARQLPILNLQNQPIQANLSNNQIKKAIMLAGAQRGWQMREVKPGMIHGSISRRGHVAGINIAYSNTSYSINYASSSNMMEKGTGTIHRNYNRWVQLLSESIQKALAHSQA